MTRRNKRQPNVHIKRGDIVVAISGDDAAGGKSGKVMKVFPEKGRAIVEGLNFVKKHMRKTQDNPEGGIVEKEGTIAISNLRVIEAAKEKPGRKEA
ncbi:MAG TPA: 50S ribosomal protein L24 [Kiritimatiellia bacterium]|nr:50S ribosomal protein L24 [Kiritimatiellia bacterium]HMO98833.1 50S ribosomal protein L24 [Kiritimatiellia bacterium]HMP96219.1 50S ribosomal protein L24 [Kiritimatiellia bacterium]